VAEQNGAIEGRQPGGDRYEAGTPFSGRHCLVSE
jgi:hypothetical protein